MLLEKYLKAMRNFLLYFILVIFLCPQVFSKEIFEVPNDTLLVGHIDYVKTQDGEDIPGIVERYGTGYHELMKANHEKIKWYPESNTKLRIPKKYILPYKYFNGVVLNISEMRLYYYLQIDDIYSVNRVLTFPVSVGRYDWTTPIGNTFIKHKVIDPIWYPPKSIIEEHEERGDILEKIVPAGPENPLGKYALNLGIKGYLIHGTNKPKGIGMRVTHGCIRLRATDIETLFALTKVGTKVKIIDKKIKITHLNKDVFIEVSDYDKTLESIPNDEFNFQSKNRYLQDIIEYTKKYNLSIDWSLIKKEVKNSSGIPILVSTSNSN